MGRNSRGPKKPKPLGKRFHEVDDTSDMTINKSVVPNGGYCSRGRTNQDNDGLGVAWSLTDGERVARIPTRRFGHINNLTGNNSSRQFRTSVGGQRKRYGSDDDDEDADEDNDANDENEDANEDDDEDANEDDNEDADEDDDEDADEDVEEENEDDDEEDDDEDNVDDDETSAATERTSSAKTTKKAKRVVKPKGIQAGLTRHGRYNKPRYLANRLVEGIAQSMEANLPKSPRNKKNHRKGWSKAKWPKDKMVERELVPGMGIGYEPKPPLYIVDNTVKEGVHAAAPKVEGLHDIKKLTDCVEIIDPVRQYQGKALIFKTLDGNIPVFVASQADMDMVGVHNFEDEFAPAFEQARHVQAQLKRGKQRNGTSESYFGVGPCRQRYGTEITLYQPGIQKEEAQIVSAGLLGTIRNLGGRVERATMRYVPRSEWYVNKELNERYGLSSIKMTKEHGMFGQYVLGYDYWSNVHKDDDFSRTVVSAYHPNLPKGYENDILHYMVFPSFGFAIAMRNRTMVCFDSSYLHCATNFRHRGTYIYSFFTNSTLATAVMANMEDRKAGVVRPEVQKKKKKSKTNFTRKKKKKKAEEAGAPKYELVPMGDKFLKVTYLEG